MWSDCESGTHSWIFFIKVLLLALQATAVLSIGTCQDIDHEACVNMAQQVPNMCSDFNLATAVCPFFCNNCPTMCYSCIIASSLYDMSECNTITCAVNEMCLMKRIVNETSTVKEMSCDTKQICKDRRRNTPIKDFHCCGTDLCNSPMLPTTTSTTESTPASTTTQTTTSTTSTTTAPPTTSTTMTSTVPTTVSHATVTQTTNIPASTRQNFPKVSQSYTLTTISPESFHPSNQLHSLPRPNQNLLYSVNASCRSDVFILVDESSNYDTFNQIVKPILHDVANQLDLGLTKVQVTLSTFNTRIFKKWDLNRYRDRLDLQHGFDQLTIQGDGLADNLVAVHSLLNNMLSAKSNIVLLFSSAPGQPSDTRSRLFPNHIKQLHQMYQSIVTIGLNNADKDELSHMASDMFHHFSIPSSSSYTHDYLVEWILHEICPKAVN